MQKYTGKCKYCGAVTLEKVDMCGHCRDKLKLIRIIQKMIRDTVGGGKND